ncbi:GTP cyclohydrolase I FolE [Clostridium hydrogeniformans]|uniref:GTP cyclohydrolase I FolE n=1 Tax=Clostridium hydrogeniformans TaxID=349933 RepID=UPI0004873BC7|nr:GTP cyclohydrolase I FolE [Clostridium hydrogeniformans]
MIDEKKIKEGVKLIIEAIGEDPNREGLQETPDRIARMYKEVFGGLYEDSKEHLSKSFTVEEDNIVIERDITYYSMCEHHFLPFFGKAHIAYIPNGKVAGLSKLARTVDVFSKRPQLQEKLTSDIGEAIMKHLDAKGVMVMVEGEHLCMTMRGVKKPGSKTVTLCYKGEFETNKDLRDEVYRLMAL